MNNRHSLSPIVFALTLALAAGSVGLSWADPTSAPPLPAASSPAAAAPPSSSTAPTSGERPATYTVVAGDSYWTIAQKFNTSVKKLKRLNNAKTNHLKPGQVLQIPPATTDAAAPAAKPTASVTPTKPKKTKSIVSTDTTQPASTLLSGTIAPETKPVATDTPTKRKKARAIATTTTTPSKIDKPADTDVATTTIPEARTARHHSKLPQIAQPVQDFDVSASTFASCPVPPSNADDDPDISAPVATPAAVEPVASRAPVAQLATPQELGKETPKPQSRVTRVSPPPAKSSTSQTPSESTFAARRPSLFTSSSSKLTSRQSAFSFTTPSNDWGNRFLAEARALGDRGIEYDESWRPPGEAHAWDMDCSNTSRYLYKVTTGIQLPRTASDQYYYLHLQNKAWDVPQTSTGFADCNYLRRNLKAGDLLFWENTYRPERQPPITHVMVFLGTNDRGQWIMAGSQTSRGGEHNRRHGGPDIYVFDPTKPCGGYSTWLGMVRHQGRFCAFGRPLEADKTKLDVAAND